MTSFCNLRGIKECCCCNYRSRRVYGCIGVFCIMIGVVNMVSYPLCFAIILSSLLLGLYIAACGIILIVALCRNKMKLIRLFPCLMLLMCVPLTVYVTCLITNFECVKTKADAGGHKGLHVGVMIFYTVVAVVDFIFGACFFVLALTNRETKEDNNA